MGGLLMMDRRLLVRISVLSGLAVLGVLAVPVAGVAAPTCAVVTGGVTYPTLQEAVDAAHARAILRVRGTCEGDVMISKDLTIRGQGDATLNGGNTRVNPGSVVTVNGGFTAAISGLTITGGTRSDG